MSGRFDDRGLYLGGAWGPSLSGERIDVHDPATGELVARSAVAGAADVDAAVDAAQRAQPAWAALPSSERARILHRAADLIMERIDDIAELLTREQGKPVPDSVKEIAFGAEVFHYYAEEGLRVGGSIRPVQRADIRSLVEWLPIGVVGAVVPWNYPVDLYAWKVAPALAAGNAIVVKPPLESPLAVGLVVQCLEDAGLPAGLLADLPGGLEAGERLSAHPGVGMITATASTRTGQAIMRSAAATMKRVSLELGGQSPFIVLDDADIAEAAAAAARRSFSNAGQICIAVNRILVADAVADEFVDAVAEHTRAIRIGHGVEHGVTGGPTTTTGVIETAEAHIADAVARGARVVTGGKRLSGGDYDAGTFFENTVLDGVPLGARSLVEETFGPVVAVHRFGSDADVAAIANDSPAGLAAYVFGGDLDRAWSVAEHIHAGGVGVNVNDITELQAPFGGWKMSGFGRELGPEGLHGFMQQRHIRLRRRY
ncbi:succinate-semialdehyde dehydrogenase/glutarate-semialdehyde dehydrogenase [Labedella gwakjiensis]|uniref:Aldehyde dehydrogenase family protein n=1 Tax=Labedella gwakjiensis TaxID=390269 RepID=A0A2P8GWS8_9MICO|nr:aldehyde dehydrogenase family protein [Labedella gwakjiensis]PSL38418.1 succinate-semialdehyde dehydrogenase/glutarate-semialdehyde dehydrogenase [Labedella gwakjiensis]RUQ87057.1 aldehyde dehydrogenase family protein [Labedella gwakjiensis]